MKLKYALLALIGLSNSVFADWHLDNSHSELSFLSTKKAQVTEMHHFKTLSGSVSDLGSVNIQIDLNSVETLIPIRNQRMQEFLFKTDVFPTANLSAQLEPALLNRLEKGSVIKLTLPAELELHGQKQTLTVSVLVMKDINNQITVASTKPVLVYAASFGLIEGINKLQSLAGLDSITHNVPVTFNLSFKYAAPAAS